MLAVEHKTIKDFWDEYMGKAKLGIERVVLGLRIPRSEVIKIVQKLERVQRFYMSKTYNEPLVSLKLVLEV